MPSVVDLRLRIAPRPSGWRTPAPCRLTALAVTTELFRDWATPQAGPASEVIYWYFNEVPKHTDAVGVAEKEKLAAAAALAGAH